ncbi:hypothetical protein DB313_04545 [Borrelia turcica IST7]|uniref:Uncharacterized protein n=1 Tax=Borrelia turcica IST7 TaxID=1104446 RepID=A0A386PP92_9SPIR|nr:hypothetical protein [Borrelia turcica]AYE36707.1 hypothetical protein DB313_04545 [Borrelia turcica IST7]
MRSLIRYFLITSLVIQACACRETEDCSTCLYNCHCNTPETIQEKIKGKEMEKINKETKNFVKKIKKEIENINQKTKKFVKEIEEDIDNDTEAIIIKTNCPKCIWGCNCVEKIYIRKKHKNVEQSDQNK